MACMPVGEAISRSQAVWHCHTTANQARTTHVHTLQSGYVSLKPGHQPVGLRRVPLWPHVGGCAGQVVRVLDLEQGKCFCSSLLPPNCVSSLLIVSTQLGGRLVHTRVSGQNISITLVLSSFLEFPLTSIGFWSSGEFPIFPHELHVSASLNSRHAEHSG